MREKAPFPSKETALLRNITQSVPEHQSPCLDLTSTKSPQSAVFLLLRSLFAKLLKYFTVFA